MIIILSAPSGGGKTSISKRLVNDNKNIMLSISVTTRKPRIHEKNNVDYYFKTIEEFQKLQEANELIEYAEVYGNLYGTPRKNVQNILDTGYDMIFNIDYQGATQIKQNIDQKVVSIFITPPSIKILKERLQIRDQTDYCDLVNRFDNIYEIISQAKNYDYIVENDIFENAVHQIQSIITKEQHNTIK